jgi:hypothetical protein
MWPSQIPDASRDAWQAVALSEVTWRAGTGSEDVQLRSNVRSLQPQSEADAPRMNSSEAETESTVTQQKPPEEGEVQLDPVVEFIESPRTGRAKKAAPFPRHRVNSQ